MRETIFLLALGSANSGIALRVIEPMLPQLASEFGIGIAAAASVITTYAIAYAIGQLAYGPLGDRYGKLRISTWSLMGAAAGSIACAFAQDIGSLAALRFATAIFASASMTLGMAHIGDTVPLAERQCVVARFINGTIIGQALGPVVGGFFTDIFGWRGTFVFLGAVFASVAMTMLARTRPQWAGAARVGAGGNPFTAHLRLLRAVRVRYVVSVSFFDAFFFFGAYSFLGAFLKLKFDLSLSIIGLILSGFGIGGVLYTLLVKPLVRIFGQRGLVAWGGAICCGCFVLTALTPLWVIAMPCTIGLGFSFYMLHNTVQTKATEMAPEARGAAVSSYAATWSLGQGAGVAFMALVVGFVDYVPAIIGFGAGFLALGLWMRANLDKLST